ncbi:hypothetical protein TNCV_2604491 [Trichonephila clavipes]|nr:hypothetical protein TNCV_2604491 [Trichonephila clavipes]
MPVPSHPLKPFSLATGLARSFNIKPFSEKAKAALNDAHLSYVKAGTADVIYQQLFSFHRSKYSKYKPVYTDELKTATHMLTTCWHYIHHLWQETRDQQIINKLHSIHPSTAHWAAVPVRRHYVR